MARFWVTTGMVIAASIALLWYGFMKYARLDLSDASDSDVANRYRWMCGAYADVPIDAARVPG